jgi:hypothetical protein
MERCAPIPLCYVTASGNTDIGACSHERESNIGTPML